MKCPFTNKSMDELYDDVINKLNFYQSQKFKVCKIWECEFKELINEDEFLKLFVKNQYRNLHNSKYVPNINPRDAFFGGRCSPAKLYHKVEFDEKILYLDFCSLYPYCCKRFPYPKGHPKIMKIFDNLDITKIKGLIFCTILPPTNLRFPVLPMRMNDKLFFTLCYECADNCIYNCDHDNEERYLTGTWCSIELTKAIEEGYKIIKIYEAWDYEEFSEMKDGQNEFFGDFINSCIKRKVEASDYPFEMNDEEKKQYINDYKLYENIDLDPNKIENNPARRTIGKLMLIHFMGQWHSILHY